jgi:hypothetical protein
MRLLKPATSPVLPDQLVRVHRRLERWRQTRRHRCPIPEALWIASASVARDFGLGRTARALRLDYYTLKKRLDALVPAAAAESPFVELVPPSSVVAAECTIEMEHPGGAKLRIHLKGAGVPDWAALSQAFWGAAP